MCTNDGKVFSCGSNDYGQLGLGHTQSKKTPSMVSGLNDYFVTHLCCGSAHSIALSNFGNVFTFGSNSAGQLGRLDSDGSGFVNENKLVSALGSKKIIQITAGNQHNIVLTSEGELFAWGLNNRGQLGVGHTKKVLTPTKIDCLSGVPIAFIACGGSHSFAISK